LLFILGDVSEIWKDKCSSRLANFTERLEGSVAVWTDPDLWICIEEVSGVGHFLSFPFLFLVFVLFCLFA
jgi:hypothetical protein